VAAASRHLHRVQILGDDLFATNQARLEEGIRREWANAILVKPNQNGTLSGTIDVLRRARAAGYATVVPARSGETEDAWLVILAAGAARRVLDLLGAAEGVAAAAAASNDEDVSMPGRSEGRRRA
jgi:enolase